MNATTTDNVSSNVPSNAAAYVLLAAFAMSYSWGYRGTVGHEAGAMIPGALLGLMACLGSGRLDWHRRSAVAGLFGAVGWAWGGSLSYMEHTLYIMSASWHDVLYGYAMLTLLGGLWAGCGGALLGIGLTEPRSVLESLTRPFIAVAAVYFAVYLYFLCLPAEREAYETFTVVHFHDGDWLSATLALVVGVVYWIVRPRDRHGAALIATAAAGWWIGYGLLTKLGGLRLAPLHRSESWGGVLGVLIVLLLYLARRRNRAALMLSLYGCVGGGLAFALAVCIQHPLRVHWGPFANIKLPIAAWRTGEISFGFFMGLALALGALRLLRGGIAPAVEDRDRTQLDVFAVFVITIAVAWMNFRRHTARVLARSLDAADNTLLGLPAGAWYVLLGLLVTIPALYLLRRYWLGDRSWAPRSAFGKGALVAMLLLWVTAGVQLLDKPMTAETLFGNLCLWIPLVLATILLVGQTAAAAKASVPVEAMTSMDDPRWRVGRSFLGVCAIVPLALAVFTGVSLAIQNGKPAEMGRLRFGPDAYWRQTARLQGTWNVVGVCDDLDGPIDRNDRPLERFEFDAYRNVTVTPQPDDSAAEQRWFLKNQYIWLQWTDSVDGRERRSEIPLHFRDGRVYIAWPPHGQDKGFLVLERRDPDE